MNSKPKEPRRVKHMQVRLNILAGERLHSLTHALQQEIDRNPGAFPGYAGRRITASDTINLMYERFMS